LRISLWIIFLIGLLFIPFPFVFVNAISIGDAITIDEKLEPSSLGSGYEFLKTTQFEFNNTSLCPTANCKVNFNDQQSNYLSLSDPDSLNDIGIMGSIQLVDKDSFGSFGPKKEKLYEGISILATCAITDIQENGKNTKYICSEGTLSFTRNVNLSSDDYKIVNATFETPSDHYVLQAVK